ncbi:LCP family protein [Nonomuraea sp. NPDC002799]
MDDLKLLRDLGGHLEHQPPVSLVRQRDRMFGTRHRRRRPGWWTAGLVAVATVATVAAVAVPALLIGDARLPAGPATAGENVDMSGARNVLVIGSDTREGAGNSKYGPMQARVGVGRRSDTIMIVHVPADRKKTTAVNVPRDSVVPIPACSSSPARTGLINSAYDEGGAACLRKTLEKLTGLDIHHSVEVDFAGFKGMVDAIGGVEVTLPRPVDDKAAKLRLPAGRSHLNGEQALGYVRLRQYGDGSDIQRIKRQQAVVLAMLKKVESVMLDPARLKALLTAVRASVKTDLTMEEMYELATDLSETRLTLRTVPWEPYALDGNRLQWKQPEARDLFDTLK